MFENWAIMFENRAIMFENLIEKFSISTSFLWEKLKLAYIWIEMDMRYFKLMKAYSQVKTVKKNHGAYQIRIFNISIYQDTQDYIVWLQQYLRSKRRYIRNIKRGISTPMKPLCLSDSWKDQMQVRRLHCFLTTAR